MADFPTPDRNPQVLLSIPSSGADGRNRLTGIFRFLGEGRFWDIIQPSTHLQLTADSLRGIVANGLDGAILAARYDAEIARILARAKIPTILMHDSWMHRPHLGRNFHFALSDHVAIGRLAARHFLSLGRFAAHGFIGDTERNRWGHGRRIGFARELRRHGLEVFTFTPRRSALRLIDRERFCGWLKTKRTPLAIFAASDRIAVQCISCCRSLGLNVPKDVAVLGVDNDETLISSCDPRLSSILPDFAEAGYAAACMLNGILSGQTVPKVKLFAPLMLVERASTASLSPSAKLMEDARACIAAHATEGLTPAALAVRLHVSRSLLDLRFRELKQGSVADAIRTRQLEEVSRLLRETDYPVRQIGRLCGFENERSLKNIFKRAFDTTMTAYRVKCAADRQRTRRTDASSSG